MAVLSSGASDIGMKRSTNQDSICLYPDRNFFAVADGMGGHNGGDIASQMTVSLLPDFIEENLPKLDVPTLLAESIKYVNSSIYKHGQANEDLKGMGTTLTAIMFNGNEMNIANVGDSRTYLINKSHLYQVSRDHSLVQEKLNIGIYDREQAKADPQKNVLIRTVGFEPEVEVDTYKYKIQKNDIFLLCSDGLHGKVSDEDIIHLVNKFIPDPVNAKQNQLDELVSELIKQANANGGQDNISVIIALAN
jgi:protein phosphatase